MKRKKIPRPTDAELEILRVLWDRGPSTVRQVLEVLNENRPTGYTTVLKFLQIMLEKGLVKRDESERTHIYEAWHPQEFTQQHLVSDLLQRAFGGSADKLVMQALSQKGASRKEMDQVRQLLDKLEGEKK